MQIQEQLDSLMAEYAVLRDQNGSPREMKKISTQVYNLLCPAAENPCSKALKSKLKVMIEINQNVSSAQSEEDVFHECFLNALEGFTPERDPNFFAYFMTTVRWYVLDNIYKKNTCVNGKNEDGTENREIREEKECIINLDDPQVTNIPDPNANPSERNTEYTEPDAGAKAKIAALITNVIGFYMHNQTDTIYQERIRYFRSFTTDYMICFAKQNVFEIVPVNEQDAFQAMDCDFLDYLMTSICRTLDGVENTPLKTYEQLAISKRGDVKLPLMGVVYKAYFAKQYQKTFSDSALSQQRDAFFQLLGIDKHAHTWILPEQEAIV